MSAPQVIMIILYALSIARGAYKHGEPDGHVNVWANVFGVALGAALLWWGGFWS